LEQELSTPSGLTGRTAASRRAWSKVRKAPVLTQHFNQPILAEPTILKRSQSSQTQVFSHLIVAQRYADS
jgi:hypothetical protein